MTEPKLKLDMDDKPIDHPKPKLDMDDKPIDHPDQDLYGFRFFAKSLAQSIEKMYSSTGTVIAINGGWGSGKSSAVNLIKHYLEAKKDGSIEITEFAPWGFHNPEALTRGFLQKIEDIVHPYKTDLRNTVAPLKTPITLGVLTFIFSLPIIQFPLSNFFPLDLFSLFPTCPPSACITWFIVLCSWLLFFVLIGLLIWTHYKTPDLPFLNQYISKENLDDKFKAIKKKLNKNKNKHHLILIDDIDRLTPDEALRMFELIKQVGNLPHVIYLLTFDRAIVEKMVEKTFPSESGSHYLEKIIQAPFALPLPTQGDLAAQMAKFLNKELMPKSERPFQAHDFTMAPILSEHDNAPLKCSFDLYIHTPRDVIRLTQILKVTWLAVLSTDNQTPEVNSADFIAIETIRIFDPELYNRIRTNDNNAIFYDTIDNLLKIATESTNTEDTENKNTKDARNEARLDSLLEKINFPTEKKKEKIKTLLGSLFPTLQNSTDQNESHTKKPIGNPHRRIRHRGYFNLYFRWGAGGTNIPMAELNSVIENLTNTEATKQAFIDASKVPLENNIPKLSQLLAELEIHKERLTPEQAQKLIDALLALEYKEDIDKTLYPTEWHFGRPITAFIVQLIIDKNLNKDKPQYLLELGEKLKSKDSLAWLSKLRNIIYEHPEGPIRNFSTLENTLSNPNLLGELQDLILEAIEAKASRLPDDPQSFFRDTTDYLEVFRQWAILTEGNENEQPTAWFTKYIKDDSNENFAHLAKLLTNSISRIRIRTNRPGGKPIVNKITEESIYINGDFIDDALQEKFLDRLQKLLTDNKLEKPYLDYLKNFEVRWTEVENGPIFG